MTTRDIVYKELANLLFNAWSLRSMCVRDIDKDILGIELAIESIAREYGIEVKLNPITNRLAGIVCPREV